MTPIDETAVCVVDQAPVRWEDRSDGLEKIGSEKMRERLVFQKAIEIIDPEARSLFVKRECGDDAELAGRVTDLLAAASQMGDFLSIPILEKDSQENEIVDSEESLMTTAEFVREASEESTAEQSNQQHTLKLLQPYLQSSEEEQSLGRLSHYEVEKVIGQGGFGIVLAARDRKLQRPVAIKVLSPTLASTSPPRKRFLREARAAASIRHPNVVSVYAVEEEPIPYLVMELIDGETVQDRIDHAGPLDVSDLMHFGRQLLAGLAAAHAVGIVHRDIKPSNILVEGAHSQVLKLTDFGLARTVDDAKLTQTGFTAGTPMYMSPEQAQGKAIDARSDLFSVASVLYAMATGRPPFRAPSTIAVLKRVADDPPRPIAEIVPEVPQWIQSIIRILHSKQPEGRFDSAQPAGELWQSCEDQWRSTGTISPDLQQRLSAVDPEYMPGKPAAAVSKIGQIGTKPAANTSSKRFAAKAFLSLMTLSMLAIVGVLASGKMGRKVVPPKVEKASAEIAAAAGVAAVLELPVEKVSTATEGGTGVSQSPPNEKPLPSGVRGVWADDAPPFATIPFTPQQASDHAQAWADYLMIPVEWKHPLGIRFRLIPPGEFMMGSTDLEIENLVPKIINGDFDLACLKSETPKHRVVITQPFYLSIHEINQRQFSQIMKQNPSWFQHSNASAADKNLPEDTGLLPVETVSWLDAANFCRELSRHEDLSPAYEIVNGIPTVIENAIGYRLPTEAEWEFACLAGSEGPYATGTDENALIGIANVEDRIGRPMPVGSLGANGFGMFDMHGNVNEWVQDVWTPEGYGVSETDATIDPRGPRSQGFRVTRGGDYFYWAADSRAAARFAATPETGPQYSTGFRISIPVTVRRAVAEPIPRDVKILLGASEQQLLQWAEEIGQDYIPVALNPRQGTVPSLVDAIAIPNESKTPWQVHCVEDDSADFEAMRSYHRPAWRMPMAMPPGSFYKTVFVWVIDIPFWQTWSGSFSFILEKAGEMGVEVFSPGSIFAINTDQGPRWALTKVPIPGAEVRYLTDVTAEELAEQMDEFRSRGWRPIRMTQHIGFETPRFAVMFRDNPHRIKWQYDAELSEAVFQSRREQMRADGMLPTMIASAVKDNDVRYRVVWSQSRGD
ncbi:MAG TPA: hypothetical protein DDZ51_13695 [Planctomycetaceae bacterium]|nr:hypothetical protein [Planctomycetaceae bacterium]